MYNNDFTMIHSQSQSRYFTRDKNITLKTFKIYMYKLKLMRRNLQWTKRNIISYRTRETLMTIIRRRIKCIELKLVVEVYNARQNILINSCIFQLMNGISSKAFRGFPIWGVISLKNCRLNMKLTRTRV